MRAITLESFDSSPALHEVPTPQIAPNEVLVRVHASSINGFDVAVASGMLQGMMEYQFPVTIGRDLAGVVEQVGSEVSRYRVGDEVFGFLAKPVLHDGTWAEYVASPEDTFIAPKPMSLDFLEAAALPQLRRPRRLPRLRDEHRRRGVEALARGRTVPAAL